MIYNTTRRRNILDIELHLLVWNELKEHIIETDASEAAEDFVRVLVEHGCDADEIAEFSIDSDIKNALLEYTDLDDDELEDDEDIDEYD